MRPFHHIVNPIEEYIRQENGGVWTGGIGSRPEVFVLCEDDCVPCVGIGNEVVKVAYELEEKPNLYLLRNTPSRIVRDAETVFNRISRFYDRHLHNLVYYGNGHPLKFDVYFYQSGLSQTVITPKQFDNIPFELKLLHLQPIYVPVNMIDGMDEVTNVLRKTNILAFLRNVSGAIVASRDHAFPCWVQLGNSTNI